LQCHISSLLAAVKAYPILRLSYQPVPGYWVTATLDFDAVKRLVEGDSKSLACLLLGVKQLLDPAATGQDVVEVSTGNLPPLLG
jgi:hypothetical protein